MKISQHQIENINNLLKPYQSSNQPGGSILIVFEEEIAYKKAFGYADLENKISCRLDSNFRLASVTKQFTAMCIMILIHRKLLSLDARLIEIFPGFSHYGSEITIHHLLNHTSGLLDYEDLIPADTKIPLRDKDVLGLLLDQNATYFPPGTQYKYSNGGYALLALIVESVSKDTFSNFLKKNIFDPLKMQNSVAHVEGITTVPHRTYGYSPVNNESIDKFIRTDQSLTSAVLGDGGIYSSATELYYWDQALYTEQLVSYNLLHEAFSPVQLGNGNLSQYGFGWYLGESNGLKTVYHSGSTIGFKTAIQRVPDRKSSIILLFNRYNVQPLELAKSIANILFTKKYSIN